MDSKGFSLRRSSSEKSTDDGANDVNKTQCIICQKNTEQKPTSSMQGRKRMIEAAAIRNDLVTKRIKLLNEDNFVYHVTNDCYKRYTLRKSLDHTSKQSGQCHDESSATGSGASTRAQSCSSTRIPASTKLDVYRHVCVICGNLKHHGTYDKFRISEHQRAQHFLQATIYFQDDVYVRTCDIQDIAGVFGADLYCHADCCNSYIKRYTREIERQNVSHNKPHKLTVIDTVISEIHPALFRGDGFTLSDIRARVTELLDTDDQITNRELKVLLYAKYGESIHFAVPIEANKSTMVFLQSCTAEEMADTIRASDPIHQCADILRSSFMGVDFGLQDKFCDAHDLEVAWKNAIIPPPIVKFFATLFNFDYNEYFSAVSSHMDNENEVEEGEEVDGNGAASKTQKLSETKRRKMMALFQIMFFIIHNGRKRTPLHMMNGQAIHEACKSSILITSFNHCGLSISYDEIRQYHNDMAALTVETSKDTVPLPSHFDHQMYTTAAFDNFDHEEATDSGIGGSHDTVSVLFQEKPAQTVSKPNISDSGITHGSKVFKTELPCQILKEFIKPAMKASLPEDYVVADELYAMDKTEHENITRKDMAWSLSRLDLSETYQGIVSPVCKSQSMPSWSAFNSLVTKENLNEQVVGFLPLIPHPVTDYTTVYTAMKNFQETLRQLDQSYLAISCDEGVYHIAREVKLLHPGEFSDLVICMGSFHMMKVVLNCLGKYLRGSGAEKVWTESMVFGINVVEAVLTGKNYARSLKGMLLLSESLERLRWCQFFKVHGTEKYQDELELLKLLKMRISKKERQQSQKIVADFANKSQELLDDFDAYVAKERSQSETFAYWDNFIQMVSLLKDLIRADREGNWVLHLHTVQRLLPLFAAFDCTNYLRWCSLYLEDMRKLPESASEVHIKFLAGKFVVKRTCGFFKAIGADMCLEQTISRAQKGHAGIIGSTRKKLFVAEWELIYHEMLAVSNLHREVSGAKGNTYELAANHEFSTYQTESRENKICDMVSLISAHENPFVMPCHQPTLHNIMTQEIMTEEIRNDLLDIRDNAMGIYKSFRRDRFITKQASLSSTIHRNNLKTFQSIHGKSKSMSTSKRDAIKEYALAQKTMDLARVREYDMEELLKYDLIPSSYLFEEEGLMTKPVKSELMQQL
jgi:hypothetical protein